MKALIVIDFVYDFVANDGKLTAGKPAQAIDENIAKIVANFNKNNDIIIVASDSHTENDPDNIESKLFPPHCIKGTKGCELFGKTKTAVEKCDKKNVFHIEKQRYSAFSGTSLDSVLRKRNIKDIYLVGVCSDICVLHTAVDAYNLGCNINVYEKGIASFNPEGHAFALNHLKNSLGASIIKI